MGRGPSVVTRRGTWSLTMPPSVVQAWKAVANFHDERGCIFVEELLHRKTPTMSHGDVIHHLKLVNEVIQPVC